MGKKFTAPLSWNPECATVSFVDFVRVPPSTRIAVNPFSTWRLHVAWVRTRAARKENPNPNPNSRDHCLLSKWKCSYGVDLAGLLGGRITSAEGRSVPSMVEYGRGVPSPADQGIWGSVVSSHSGVRGRAPAENGFWRISKATERSFLYLYDKIWGRQFALASPAPNSGGTRPRCPPRDLRPCT